MLLPSFFVVSSDRYDDVPDVQLPDNAYIAYHITYNSRQLVESFYKKLYLRLKNYPFCLLIDLGNQMFKSDADFDKITDLLVSLSFHSEYIKANHGDPLVLSKVGKTGASKYIPQIAEAFKSQGYNNIETKLIDADELCATDNGSRLVHFDLNSDVDGLFSDYIGCVKELTTCDLSFFFFLADPCKLGPILDVIQKAETKIREEFSQTYKLLKENALLFTKKKELMLNVQLMQEQLDSIGNYHLHYDASDSLYKRQITELLRFYNNEYEILPTWYKRFGHIIKVLMGKRTFRSLFDDSVKKYKD